MEPALKTAAAALRASPQAYARATLFELEAVRPELAAALPPTFAAPLGDIEVRLLQLSASLTFDRPELLAHALAWYKVALHHRDVPADYLPATLSAISSVLERELPATGWPAVAAHLAAASQALDCAPNTIESHLGRNAPHGELALRYLIANLEGRGDEALDMVRQALRDGVSIAELHDHVLIPVQREAGRMWLMAEISIADEHYTSGITERALGLLDEQLTRPSAAAPCVVTLGVSGDLHGIGLRVIGQRLQHAGFRVHNLGANMPAEDMRSALEDRPLDLIAVSATILLNLPAAAQLVRALRDALQAIYGNSDARPIIIGGEPFRVASGLHLTLGADAAAIDAPAAVEAARQLVAPSC